MMQVSEPQRASESPSSPSDTTLPFFHKQWLKIWGKNWGRLSWRLLVLTVLICGLLGAAIIFPLYYRTEQKAYNRQWSKKCQERAELISNAFAVNKNWLTFFVETIRMFYIVEKVMDHKKFLGLLSNTPSTRRRLTRTLAFYRIFPSSERAAYEQRVGHPLMDVLTGEVSGDLPYHVVMELVEDEPSFDYIGTDAGSWNFNGWVDGLLTAGMTGLLGCPPPLTPDEAGVNGEQYILLGSYPVYSKIFPEGSNATAEERMRFFVGAVSVAVDIKPVVKDVEQNLENPESIMTKLVDLRNISDPKPAYLDDQEVKANQTWGRDKYKYHSDVKLLDETVHYELWCTPERKFFPTKALWWSVGILGVSTVLAQLLWVLVRSLELASEETARVRLMNQGLAEAKREAEEHSMAKSTFLASVSHEIRTPMNGVLGMLSLLLDTTQLSPVQMDYAATALSCGKALLSLVNDVLDLSKIESACMELEAIPFSPADELDDVVSMFGERSRGKRLELAALVHESVPALLLGDPGRFRQIIINLIGNSIKFCKHGHILVRVMAFPDDPSFPNILSRFHAGTFQSVLSLQEPTSVEKSITLSGRPTADWDCCWSSVEASIRAWGRAVSFTPAALHLLVWVEDTGVGIPEEAKSRIFQPFMQAEKSTTRKYGGTGIGLNISKQLVNLMGGQVTFTSRVSYGTTFRLDVRMALVPNSAHRGSVLFARSSADVNDHKGANQSAGEGPVKPVKATGLAGLQAMCVDENPLRAELTAHYLRGIGMLPETLITSLPWTSTPIPAVAMGGTPGGTPAGISGTHSRSTSQTIQLSVGSLAVALVESHTTRLQTNPGGTGGIGYRQSEETSGQGTGTQPATARDTTRSLLRMLAQRTRLADQRLSDTSVRLVLLVNEEPSAKLEEDARLAGFACTIVKPLRRATMKAMLLEALGFSAAVGSNRQSGPLTEDGMHARAKRLEGLKILVVDDNAVNLKVAAKLLEKNKGLTVTCVNSGQKALHAVEGEHEFDLIFMDIQMPGMDGYEATSKIRAMEASGQSKPSKLVPGSTGIPIVALTADVMKGSLEKALESGMTSVIPKPIQEERVLQMIEDVLRGEEDGVEE